MVAVLFKRSHYFQLTKKQRARSTHMPGQMQSFHTLNNVLVLVSTHDKQLSHLGEVSFQFVYEHSPYLAELEPPAGAFRSHHSYKSLFNA